MCLCAGLTAAVKYIAALVLKPTPLCSGVNCNCFICANMAQAQLDAEMKMEASGSSPRGGSFRKGLKLKLPKFHAIPIMLRINSKPLIQGVTPKILLDDDWMMFIGGSHGQTGEKTHINIRKINFDPKDEGIAGEGISLPLVMLPCLQEGFQQLVHHSAF